MCRGQKEVFALKEEGALLAEMAKLEVNSESRR